MIRSTLRCLILLVVIVGRLFSHFSHCLSLECSTTVIISYNQSSCQRINRSENSKEWQCADLQSALESLVYWFGSGLANDLQAPQNTSSCISVAVPPGDHFISAPVHFNSTSVYIYGTGESSDNATIFCNYTVDVDQSRIFDPDYSYTDYTFYFNRSEMVSFENVQFVGCPYPLRLDTVATVRVHNSLFRWE